MSKQLVKEIEDTYTKLLETLSLIPGSQIDTIPFEGSWTAGQLAEHLIRAGFSAGDFFRKNVEPSQRPPDAAVEQIKSIFLNFDTKLESADFIAPLQTVHDKDEQLKELERIKNAYIDAAEHLDLSYLCLGFALPGAGHLTRLEWISLNIYHMQRHTRQLQNIYRALQAARSTVE